MQAMEKPIESQRNLVAALHLAGLGFKVFPANPDKTPVRGFKWKQDATTDPDVIRGWWTRRPGVMPALPTGPVNGVSVVDLDCRDGKDGLANWRALGHDTDAGLIVETPSGGLHLYYTDDNAAAPQTAGSIAPGVDTRGRGGYVIAPGAVLPDGRSYRVTGGDIDWFQMGIAPTFPVLRAADRPIADQRPDGSASDLATIGQALLRIPNDAAYGPWVRTLMAVHDATGGSLEGLDLARAWCASYAGYSRKEVTDKWRSFGKSDHAAVTVATLYAEARLHGWQAVGADAFDDDPDPEPPAAIDRTDGSRLTFLSPSECVDLPARDYLVKGLIAPGQVGCIFGEPGAGKSVIAPWLAYALAQGREAFGLRTRAGGVFYVACEDQAGMADRIKALHATLGDADGFKLVTGCSDLFAPGPIDGKGSRDMEALRAAVKRNRPALIVIDTLAMAMPGMEENDAAAMNRVVQIGKALARRGAAVIFVHHGTKAEGSTPRGHSVFNGALDFSLQVKPADQAGIVRGVIRKNRNGPAALDIAFRIVSRIVSRIVGTDVDGDPVTAPICQPCGPLDAADTGPRLSPSETAALGTIRDMAGPTGEVLERAWRDAATDGMKVSAAEERDSRRRSVERALKGLVQKRVVEVADGTLRLVEVSSIVGTFNDDDSDGESDDAAG